MKKTITIALGFVLSGLMAAAVHAGPNDGSEARQQDVRSAQSGTSAQPAPLQRGLSKRNKAVLQQTEAAKMRRDQIRSSASGTMQKKSLSKRNKAVILQTEEAKKRKDLIKSSETNTVSK